MKWLKLGKIFDPTEHLLPNDCTEFAQSPQALVLDDRIRIYFSTRKRDSVGKYLSHIAYVDYDWDLRSIIGVCDHTVIELGERGCFDEHGIFPVNIFQDNNRVLAYTTGWNRKVSVSADASIGLAVSQDGGNTFQKYGKGPVMAATLTEPFLVADAFVARYDDIYHMWYIFGSSWKKFDDAAPPDRIYKIAHATSVDAINWERNGKPIISDRLNADECQALPTVLKLGNRYHMYFCYREAYGFREFSDRAYRIGYAYSDDGRVWMRDDSLAGIEVSESGWDAEMQCYPHLFKVKEKIYMLYNGNEFGRNGFGAAVLQSDD